jgi:hypothetical protein
MPTSLLPAKPVKARQQSQRQPELDALRGLLLLWMTLTHLPTHASEYVNQPFGFVSAAEGFVFLSAVLTGKLHARFAYQSTPWELCRRLWGRARRVYWYHVGLLAFAFTVGAWVASHGARPRPELHNLLDFFFTRPWTAIVSSLLLVYCPPLLDILPMYVLFLLLTPALLLGARRVGWGWMLGLSGTIWLWAQFGLRHQAYDVLTRLTHQPVPLVAWGAFNLWGWQFLWAIGIWLGVEIWEGNNPLARLPRWSLWVAVPIAIAGACLRRSWPTGIFWSGSLSWWQDKWRLAPLRVVNATAMGIVVWRTRRWLRAALTRGPLPMVGMASIQVFSAHVVCVFFGLSLLHSDADPIVHGAPAVALLVGSIVTLVIVGLAVSSRKMQERAERKAEAALARNPSRGAPARGKLDL